MAKKKEIWKTIWQIIEFVLKLGLSHINKHKKNK